MATMLEDAQIDELIAGRKVVEYHDEAHGISLMTIPGIENLPESQLTALRSKLLALDAQKNPLNVEALEGKLNDYANRRSPSEDHFPTPPPLTEAEEIEEARVLEAKSRLELIKEGCPPCHLAHNDFPSLQQLPEEFDRVVSHWQSIGGATLVPLKSQLNDWERFRNWQQRIRPWMSRNLPVYKQKILDRRRKHGLEEDLSLHLALQPHPKQQEPLENWVEFQYNHLGRHETMEAEIQEVVEEIDGRRRQVREVAGLQTKLAQEYRLGLEIRENWLATLKRRLASHAELLRWIEEQRLIMVEGHTASTHDSRVPGDRVQHGQEALSKPRISTGRKRDQRPRPATGSAIPTGISKNTPQRRSARIKQAGASQRKHPRDTETILNELCALQTTNSSPPDPMTTKSRLAKSKLTALRPLRPQRIRKATTKVPKEKPSSRSIGKSHSKNKKPRKTKTDETQKLLHQHPATRIGRIAKQPDRFRPG